MLYKYSPSILSNSRDEMSRFRMSVVDLMRDECPTAMLHGNMTLERLMMYAQSIEEFKHKRISIHLKRSGFSDQDQIRFKKWAQTQEDPRSTKVKFERGGVLKMKSLQGSHVEKETM